jgi:hypothetical protein
MCACVCVIVVVVANEYVKKSLIEYEMMTEKEIKGKIVRMYSNSTLQNHFRIISESFQNHFRITSESLPSPLHHLFTASLSLPNHFFNARTEIEKEIRNEVQESLTRAKAGQPAGFEHLYKEVRDGDGVVCVCDILV